MGQKTKKIKEALSPTPKSPPPPVEPTNVDDDDDLLNELMAHLDAKDSAVQAEAATVIQEVGNKRADDLEAKSKVDGKSRFLARKARKDAERAAQYTDNDPDADAQKEREAKKEERAIQAVCDKLGLEMHEIAPDGHCLFAAIADQLRLLNIVPADANYATMRVAASQYMFTHPNDFLPFLPSVEQEGASGEREWGMMGPKEFEHYCADIRNTAVWGGEPEILALSRAYNVPIHVIQDSEPTTVVHNPAGTNAGNLDDKRVVRISYHRWMYGLGEHYNSLRPKKSAIEHIKSAFAT